MKSATREQRRTRKCLLRIAASLDLARVQVERLPDEYRHRHRKRLVELLNHLAGAAEAIIDLAEGE